MDTKNIKFENIVSRFLSYVAFDTQSSETSQTTPSTAKQKLLAQFIVDELQKLGLTDAAMDEFGYVYASLPANVEGEPVIGLIAHLDTSPDASGENVKAKIAKFDGNPVLLNGDKNIYLSPVDFPEMNHYLNQDLIVTDGTTLLGADDKAGVSEIVTAVEYLLSHPEVKHGAIKIAFTPDEEIGCGADHFNVERFGADWAYTMDGGEIGELEYENFNAAAAKVVFHGRNIHPGSAKNRMVNASLIAMQFHSMLPAVEAPQHTEGREGFFHLTHMEGEVELASLDYIIRDHDSACFEKRKSQMIQIAEYLNLQYGKGTVELNLRDQYYNMIEQIKPVMHIVERAENAMRQAGIEPKISPVRGGTDGARLSFMNLPCPNIFAGGLNFHGRFEFIPVEALHAAVRVILGIVAK